MKKVIALLLALVMVLSLAGCGSDKANEELEQKLAKAELELANADLQLTKAQQDLEKAQQQLAEAQQKLSQADSKPSLQTVTAVNATVNGKTSLEITQPTDLTAVAAPAEGQILDHWRVNGQIQEGASGNALIFTAQGNTLVEAVLRDEKKLTTVNATIQFLDAKGKASGDTFTEFVFEEDYANPVTKQTCPGGKITAQIKANVPSGKTVDYWLINGVPYFYNAGVTSFTVENLDETTVYEVVFKDKSVTNYKVTCRFCTFSGKTSGYVAAGSTITVKGDGNISGYFVINGVRDSKNYISSITLEINQDTEIDFYAIIN
ncbi:MAG: hypothetical protein IJN53_03510 [Oscillospiraceae bacterium]|nr:hypothetical protein [Oscillospiraceae bacterium]